MTLIDEDAPPTVVEPLAPGVYDMPFEHYLARPELSSTGMRALLPPSCPAQFHWDRLNPVPPKKEWDFGQVAHKLVLGVGHEIEVLDFDDFRTTKARDAKKDAYEQGKIPILEKDHRYALAMAAEVRKHPVARLLLRDGKPEQSLFWRDRSTGTEMKARVDWLGEQREGRRLKVVDYKSAARVDAESIRRAIAEHGYHQQGATYREAGIALGRGDEDTVVCLIFQSKTPPFFVHVVQLTPVDLQLGAARNRRAIQIYRECLESGEWPAYPEVSHIEMPAWAQINDQLEYLA